MSDNSSIRKLAEAYELRLSFIGFGATEPNTNKIWVNLKNDQNDLRVSFLSDKSHAKDLFRLGEQQYIMVDADNNLIEVGLL